MDAVEPTTLEELAQLVRTQADNLCDLRDDLVARDASDAALNALEDAISAAYTAYDELHTTWWNK